METINFKETARKQSRTNHNNMILVEMEGGGGEEGRKTVSLYFVLDVLTARMILFHLALLYCDWTFRENN